MRPMDVSACELLKNVAAVAHPRTILVMSHEAPSQPEPNASGPATDPAKPEPVLFGAASAAEKGSFPWKPVLVAAAVLAIGVGVLVWTGNRSKPGPQFATSELAPPDAYAASLPISDIKMSEADSFAGNKATYIDGTLTNNGDKTVDGAMIQVVFQDDMNQMAQKDVLSVNIIRAHEPYVDTVPIAKAPIKPGQTAEFRLIFDHVTGMWNQQYPQLTVVKTSLQ
jgi:hypothetical protein